MSKSLPGRPNFEHLKNEAKSLLKAHREGEPTCCDTLRNLHRFAGKPDQEVLSASVALAEVQYALALEYGFKSWTALKEHVRELQKTDGEASVDDSATAHRTFGEREAWAAIESGVGDVKRLPESARWRIYSITVTGSLVRGDFVENRSGVHLFTVLRGVDEPVWESDVHRQVRACFEKYFSPYKGLSRNPGVWDDVCIGERSLPRRSEESGRHRIKALGIHFFDTRKHHRTVFGEDFTLSMPEPVDPKPLVPERLQFLLNQADEIVWNNRQQEERMPLLAEGAVVALQLYFDGEPSLNKFEVLPRYEKSVPDFAGKGFGKRVWNNYLSGEINHDGEPLEPFDEYYRFLQAARDIVGQHPI
jgi:hypothetical protein